MTRRYRLRRPLAFTLPMTLLVLTIGVCTAKQAPVLIHHGPNVAQNVRALVMQVMDATQARDIEALNRLLADDFRLSGAPLLSEGDFVSKAEYLHTVRNALELISYEFKDLEITAYGPVVMVHSRLHWNGRVPRGPMEGYFFMSDVWLQQGDCWKLVARHMSRLGRRAEDRFRNLRQLIL
jgi:ketosteroid isomerase-like protein